MLSSNFYDNDHGVNSTDSTYANSWNAIKCNFLPLIREHKLRNLQRYKMLINWIDKLGPWFPVMPDLIILQKLGNKLIKKPGSKIIGKCYQKPNDKPKK